MKGAESVSPEHLANQAVLALRRITKDRSREENRQDAVQAAVLVDGLLKDLRRGQSGRAVLLAMLQAASPDSVSMDELRYASGIQEFARRIRELREEGYDIRSTGNGYRFVE